LERRWNPKNLQEGDNKTPGTTSYTVDKGKQVVLCMRDNQDRLHAQPVLLYVLLHELAHMMSESMSVDTHNDEFKTNFQFLLGAAKSYQLYESQNQKAVPYCNIVIDHLP
jgi:hypothetical protein